MKKKKYVTKILQAIDIFMRYFYMKVIVIIILINLVTNYGFYLFVVLS